MEKFKLKNYIDDNGKEPIIEWLKSLDGSLRNINGVLPLVSGLKDVGVTTVFVPFDNAREAALVQGVKIYGAKHLCDIVNHYLEILLEVFI